MSHPENAVSLDVSKVKSPEIYFGSARNNTLANKQLYLGGSWNVTDEYAENTAVATIEFPYDAKNVYMAAGSDGGVEVEIYKDDIFVKKILIKDEQLYSLIEGSTYGAHTLQIKIPAAGLKAFTFTFG